MGCIMGELTDGQPLFPGESEIDQLYVIQKVLGPLTSDQNEQFMRNPRFIGCKFPQISRPETLEKRFVGKLSKQALSFMKGLLAMDPNERMSSTETLQHPWFDDIREKDESFNIGTRADSAKMRTKIQNQINKQFEQNISKKSMIQNNQNFGEQFYPPPSRNQNKIKNFHNIQDNFHYPGPQHQIQQNQGVLNFQYDLMRPQLKSSHNNAQRFKVPKESTMPDDEEFRPIKSRMKNKEQQIPKISLNNQNANNTSGDEFQGVFKYPNFQKTQKSKRKGFANSNNTNQINENNQIDEEFEETKNHTGNIQQQQLQSKQKNKMYLVESHENRSTSRQGFRVAPLTREQNQAQSPTQITYELPTINHYNYKKKLENKINNRLATYEEEITGPGASQYTQSGNFNIPNYNDLRNFNTNTNTVFNINDEQATQGQAGYNGNQYISNQTAGRRKL